MQRVLLILLAAGALAACGAPPPVPLTVTAVPSIDPSFAITAAAKTYLSRFENIKLGEDNVIVEQVEGDFARVRIFPEEPANADPAWVFLQKRNGDWWEVVAGPGTAFGPDDLQAAGIPESLAPAP
jgi:hypothetical protein